MGAPGVGEKTNDIEGKEDGGRDGVDERDGRIRLDANNGAAEKAGREEGSKCDEEWVVCGSYREGGVDAHRSRKEVEVVVDVESCSVHKEIALNEDREDMPCELASAQWRRWLGPVVRVDSNPPGCMAY